jgi:hypothetical protein
MDFTQADDIFCIPNRQKLTVSPQVRGPGSQIPFRNRLLDPLQIIPNQERLSGL